MIFPLEFKFKDRIFHSAVICGPELCKRDAMMKTRLATNIDGYPMRFRDWYCSNKLTPMVLTWFKLIEIPMKSLVWALAYFLFL